MQGIRRAAKILFQRCHCRAQKAKMDGQCKGTTECGRTPYYSRGQEHYGQGYRQLCEEVIGSSKLTFGQKIGCFSIEYPHFLVLVCILILL